MNLPLILCAYASLFALGLSDNARGPLFPEILRAFDLSNTTGSWMYVVSSLGGAVGAATGRWWSARFTRVKTLNLTILGMSLGLFVYAAAPGFGGLIVGAVVTGYAMGLMGRMQNTIVALASDEKNRSRLLGGLHAMYGISSLLAPLVVAACAALGGAWRWSFAIVGVFSLVVFFWNHLRFQGAEHGSLAHPHALPPIVQTASKIVSVWMAIGVGSYVIAEILLSSRLALYWRLENGATLETSSFVVTGFFVAMLAGRLVTAALPVKGSPKGPLLACLAASAALIVLGLTGGAWALPLTGLTMGPIYPLAVAFLGREFGEGIDGLMGWVTTIQGALVASMHLGAGWITDVLGIRSAMLIGPAALALSFTLIGSYGPFFRRHAARI